MDTLLLVILGITLIVFGVVLLYFFGFLSTCPFCNIVLKKSQIKCPKCGRSIEDER